MGLTRADELRARAHPLFGPAKLKLGTFCTNLSGGCTMSDIEGVLDADWASTVELAGLAEAMDFEALVPVARWKGFGGQLDFNSAGFETYAWAAGISALTRRAGVFATSHVPTIHPIMAAKQAMTIDHISGGRFALNVVTGWHRHEIEMFGQPMLEHDKRYAMAAEWLTIMKRLWTEEAPFDFEGEFYRIGAGTMQPKPIQKPYPVIMSAGVSTKGKEFAARHCDVSFVNLDSHELNDMRARVKMVRDLAWNDYGREIQIWCNAYVFQGSTQAEARRYYQNAVIEHGDWEGADNLLTIMGINSQSLAPEVLPKLKEHFMAGWGGFQLLGAPDEIVEGLGLLRRAGFDGVLLSWPRYIADMRRFKDEIYPLVRQSGLR